MSRFSIVDATSAEDLDEVRRLFRAYVDWIDIDLSYQGFEEELARLPGKYVPPLGALLIAKGADGVALGCVGVRAFGEDGSCEMKRLYVTPESRGLGVGAALVDCVLERARRAGFKSMKLDTLPTMTGAIKIYKEAGFSEVPAYYETPIEETVFFQCSL